MGTKLSERTVQPYGKRRIRPSAGRFTVQAFAHSCAHACATAITIVASVLATRAAEHDFYKDKQVRLIISSASGGVYDTFGRLMARFLPAHLPGRPTIIVQNMPGASGLRAVNYLYNGAPRDGTVIAGVHNGIPTAPFEEPKQARFDVNELSWIGSISEDPFVGYVWHGAPVQTYEDAKKSEIVIGNASVNSMGAKMAVVSNAMFGTKLKLVIGYENSSKVKLALERGELHGTFANSWGDLKTLQPDWIRDGKVTIIIQHGYDKIPELPNVPRFIDQAQNSADRQALDLLLQRQKFARPYVAPPGVPHDRLERLRRAFDATVRDPDFLRAVHAARLSVDNPMSGEQLSNMVARLSTTPTAVTARLAKLFDDYLTNK